MKEIVHYIGLEVHTETIVVAGPERADILAALARRSRRVRDGFVALPKVGSFLANLGLCDETPLGFSRTTPYAMGAPVPHAERVRGHRSAMSLPATFKQSPISRIPWK